MVGGTAGREVRPFIGPWWSRCAIVTISRRRRYTIGTQQQGTMTVLALGTESAQNNNEKLQVMFLVSQTGRMASY